MSHRNSRMHRRCAAVSAVIVAAGSALGAFVFGCDSPEQYLPFAEFGGPAGVLDGTVAYSGPLPCTEGKRVVGSAILLALDVRLLPPPAGLGTSAASLAVIPGETLFAGVRDRLVFNADGSRWCPPPSEGNPDETVNVSADWAISPLGAATYQVRGFYDLDGDFDPAFSVLNLPTKGDIGGGAIENTAQVLQGAPARYREMTLIASERGSRIQGVAVTLGLPIPLERPVFFPAAVSDKSGANKDPMNVVMPSDFQLDTYSLLDPDATEESFLSITLGAGVPAGEIDAAKGAPFGLPVDKDPMKGAFLFFSRQDVNYDGKIDSLDHTPESGLIPAFYPLSVFSRLSDGSDLVSQSMPTVILQGLTIWKSLGAMGLSMLMDKSFEPAPVPGEAISPSVKVAIRPAALCLHAANPTRPGLLVVSHETDKSPQMHRIIGEPKVITEALAKQFGRPIEIAYGCLPEGRYAMSLIYETGQGWTLPNEASVCSPLEPLNVEKMLCGTRPKLLSQGAVLTIGKPVDPSYCSSAPDAQRILAACSPAP